MYNKETWDRYFQKNKEKLREKSREYRKNNLKKERNRQLVYKYGITLNDYERLLKEQDCKCALCNNTESLVVDHCHNSGNVRGLLCRDCNLALGLFKDDAEVLNKAVKYIETANSWI